MWIDPQNYTVTEGDVVNITLVTSTSDYMFDFTVTLECMYMDGSALGESCYCIKLTGTFMDILTQFMVMHIAIGHRLS